MKKIISLILVSILCLTLAGCGKTGQIDNESTPTQSQSDAATQDILKRLVAENDYCNRFVFGADSLHTKGDAIKDNIFEVDSEKFADYAAFKDYLLTVYTADYVDFLLTNYPNEGVPKYVNIDGKLCLNADLSGARGYYVDWSNVKIEITKADKSNCSFTAIGSIEEPADPPVKEDYPVDCTAVFENGKWVLTKMFY